MTREEATRIIKECKDKGFKHTFYTLSEYYIALNMAIKALEVEPLTDIEQRIFLAAMGREKEVCKESGADGDGWVDLVAVCRSIERKVKRALWS